MQVVRAAKKFDTRASASTDVDVDAIVKDLQEKVSIAIAVKHDYMKDQVLVCFFTGRLHPNY